MANYKRTKLSCYFSYLSMASIFSLPPLLFNTFHENYGVSYTLLGTLVAVNFCTQLTIDLIFTFFTKYFNIKKTVTVMPLITSVGMLIYALIPWLFPQYAYIGLVIGTVIFSVSAGLSEVLLSPVVAAIPSETPDKDMSLLHSLYAYGVLLVVIVSTAFLKIFGTENWMYLTLFWAFLPVIAFIMFSSSPMPEVNITNPPDGKNAGKKNLIMTLCVLCIFFGSAAENSMTNWISSYMEIALTIPKVIGDILGMAAFAVALGLTRTWYSKKGKNIYKVLFLGMAGAVVCYITAGLSPFPALSLVACIMTGMCTAMLWPGSLILMEEKLPHVGVAAYALMAAGGDFGASIAPQLLGLVVDKVKDSSIILPLSEALSISTEQLGMKAGMLAASIFPVIGVIVLIVIKKALGDKKALN
ncbi:MAG: MFS transporter [Ruminococcaceae bacterium]|nr:MFS transporter [Oscillospiraceae bacterium]